VRRRAIAEFGAAPPSARGRASPRYLPGLFDEDHIAAEHGALAVGRGIALLYAAELAHERALPLRGTGT